MVPVTLPDGTETRIPALPIELDGRRLGLRSPLPKPGEHNAELLGSPAVKK
jgi:crotonobetainyl-CoA:carnitine CoA-transferase CaiB-like acyl-CoA transferase